MSIPVDKLFRTYENRQPLWPFTGEALVDEIKKSARKNSQMKFDVTPEFLQECNDFATSHRNIKTRNTLGEFALRFYMEMYKLCNGVIDEAGRPFISIQPNEPMKAKIDTDRQRGGRVNP